MPVRTSLDLVVPAASGQVRVSGRGPLYLRLSARVGTQGGGVLTRWCRNSGY
jgi:hypothetical protein